MYIEYVKDHPVGIKSGTPHNIPQKDAEKFIREGYAEEINESRYNELRDAYYAKLQPNSDGKEGSERKPEKKKAKKKETGSSN